MAALQALYNDEYASPFHMLAAGLRQSSLLAGRSQVVDVGVKKTSSSAFFQLNVDSV